MRLCLLLKNAVEEFLSEEGDAMEAMTASTSSMPSAFITFLAPSVSCFFAMSQRGLSGMPNTIKLYMREGMVMTPSIQRQSFSPPMPSRK